MASNALPLILGAGALFLLMGKKKGSTGGNGDGDGDTGGDGNDDGSNDDGSNDDGSNDDGSNDDGSNDDGSNDDGSGGGGNSGIGKIKGSGVPRPEIDISGELCFVAGTGSLGAKGVAGGCVEFWSSKIRTDVGSIISIKYLALGAAQRQAVCAPDIKMSEYLWAPPPERVEFLTGIIKNFWPELNRSDIVFPPKSNQVSNRPFPKAVWDKVLGLFLTSHCGFSN